MKLIFMTAMTSSMLIAEELLARAVVKTQA